MLIEATHVSGKPLVEPAARYGPIIVNTQGQIRQTFEELAKRKLLKAS